MTETEAKEIIRQLAEAADAAVATMVDRITEYEADYAEDPWEDTKAMIRRLESRIDTKTREAEALAFALGKFDA